MITDNRFRIRKGMTGNHIKIHIDNLHFYKAGTLG